MRNFFIFLIINSFLSFSVFAHGPTRQQVKESIVINAPVDKVWEMVGDFSGLHKWHPAVQDTEMKSDDVRILSLDTDKKITEKLVKIDQEKKKLKYKITDMSVLETFEFAGSQVERKVLPVNTYTGFLSVKAEGEGSIVEWKGKFYRGYLLNPPTPEGMSDKDATSTISAVYKGGLENLKKMLESSSSSNAVAEKAVAVKTGFDPDNSYQEHVKCEAGKKCKIDTFLLKGFRAFSQCQVCHGLDGNGSTIAPSLLGKLQKGMTYEVFVDRVANGYTGSIGVMPPWKDNPNVMKKMDNLYAYLKARSEDVIPSGRLKKFKK